MSNSNDFEVFLGASIDEGINLLIDTKYEGFVLKIGNWICIAPEEDEITDRYDIFTSYKGFIIHIESNEDAGWYYSIYDCGKKVLEYGCTWIDDIKINDSVFSYDILSNYLKIANINFDEQYIQQIHYPNIKDIFNEDGGDNPYNKFIALIGISNVYDIGYNFLLNLYDCNELPDNIIYVDKNYLVRDINVDDLFDKL